MDGDGDPDTDLYAIQDACKKDNYVVFRSDGTVEDDEGLTKCDLSDPQKEVYNWSLKNNDAILVIDGAELTIEQLDQTALRLKISEFGLTTTTTHKKF